MTPLAWLQQLAAEHKKTNFLHAPQFEGSRILLFTSSKTQTIPTEDLGEHAHDFMQKAQQYYAAGDWSPPLSATKVIDIYRAFTDIDIDLTGDPLWSDFWTQYEQSLINPKTTDAEINRLKFLIRNAQAQILTGYRFKIIGITNFLQSQENESKAEHGLKEIRCRSFFQQINRYKRELPAEECYYRLMDIFEKSLINEVEVIRASFEVQLNGSKKVEQSIAFLERAVTQIKSKLELEFLGVKANYILRPLEDIISECHQMKDLIDQSLENICKEAVPGIDARILIDLEMPAIESSLVYQHMSETTAHFTARYLTSPGVLKTVHDNVYTTRVNATIPHYSEPVPFWKVQEKIHRVTSLSRKRAFLELLFEKFQNDKLNFPDQPQYLKWLNITLTPRQKQFIKMLQKHFLNSLKREYNEISQDMALKHLNENINKRLLQPLGKASFWDTIDDSAQLELADFIENPPQRTSPMGSTLSLFDPLTPMEIDITLGVLHQLGPVLKYVKTNAQISLASAHDNFEDSLDFNKLVSGEVDVLALSKALRHITDLPQRKKTIMQLFEFVTTTPSIQQDDSIPVLQELFINAVKEEVRRFNPKNIDEKNIAYQTILAPAKASPLIQYGDKTMTHSLLHKLDALMERISV
jgi:hypothetical protein